MSNVLVPNPLILTPHNTGLTEAQFLQSLLDGPHADAYARRRVTEITTIFDSQAQYRANNRDWVQQVSGTGAVTHLPNESTAQLSTGGTASGAYAIRQTRLCWRYQPGKSQIYLQTFSFGPAAANVRRRIGYFDDRNGIFLEQNENDVRFVIRSYVTGVASDARFATQNDWNVDRLDGTGPSRHTLDLTKVQLMFMDFQSPGTSRVRVGFYINGVPIVAHEFLSSGLLTTVGVSTVNLPVRGEVVNTGVAGAASTMKMVHTAVMSEGGAEFSQRGNLNSASNGTTPITVNTRRPILSIRPALNYFGQPNRAWYTIIEAILNVRTNDIFWEVVFGGTLTGAVWNAAFADSSVEFDVAATAITGEVSVVKGYGVAGQGNSSTNAIASIAGNFPNSTDSLNNTQLGHTLVATSMSGNASVAAVFNWRELF